MTAPQQRQPGARPCNWHYFLSAVNANGSVSPCCGVQEEIHDFGTLVGSSFRDVWHNPLFRGVRGLYAGREPENLAAVEESICASCPFPEDQQRCDDIIVELLRSAPRKIQKRALKTLSPRWTRGLSIGNRRERGAYYNTRWENFLLALQEQEAGVETPRSFPFALIIDPSSACPLRCPMCPVSYEESVRSKTTLDWGVLDRLLDEVGDYLFSVEFFNWGEPLVNKQLPEMIRRLKQFDLTVRISTSLSIEMADSVCDSLVECGVDVLTVSIDGFTQENYQKYRINGDLALALGNMQKLAAIKRTRNTTKPVIDWQYLVFSFNEHEIEDARAFAESVGAEFRPIAPFVNVDEHPDWLSSEPEFVLDRYKVRESRRRPRADQLAAIIDLTTGPCESAITDGFHDWQKGRWMGVAGTVMLDIPVGCDRIVVSGYAPREVLDGGQTLALKSGAETLGEITIEKPGAFARTFRIDPASARVGGTLASLTFTASNTFVPSETSESPDARVLSVLLTRIEARASAMTSP